MKKGQSNRLTVQQKEGQGPITIFHKDAKYMIRKSGIPLFLSKNNLSLNFPCLHLDTERTYIRKKLTKR